MVKLGLVIKLTIAITVLLILSISILSLFLVNHEKTIIDIDLKERGLALASNLAYNAEYGVLTANTAILSRLVTGVMAQPDVVYCIIRDLNGNVLTSSGLDNKMVLPERIITKKIQAEEPVLQEFRALRDNNYQNYYDISVPVKSKAGGSSATEEAFFLEESQVPERKIGVVAVGLSLSRIDVLVRSVKQNIMFMAIVMLFIAGIISVFLTRIILGPVKRLMEATQRISTGDLNFRVLVKTRDEIGILADSFNKMVDDLLKITVSRDELAKEVTERKKAEEELKSAYEQLKHTQAQLVQSAKMASVGLLAGGVAHEINNPLTGVLNNVQLIKIVAEQKKDFNLDDFKELLDAIEESAQRCTKITRSLLGFSRASKGVFQDLSLNEMIEKVFVLIEHELKLENIIIQRGLEPSLPKIKGDTQLLQQIIFDIITNAKWAIQRKSEKEGGTITIKTKHEPKDNSVLLSISDTGIGITKENMERVFEPFFTTKPVGEGTGLGLAIVYNIIKEHNGTITVESQENQGTTFKISLPVVSEEIST